MQTDTQYYYFRCPTCGQSMRLPRGVGKVEVTCRAERVEETVAAVKAVHPYEEPVINVLPLCRTGQ